MDARPMPVIGALLGLVLGALVMALMWVTGILPPDRLPLFGLLAVGVILVGSLLTQRMWAARGRFMVVVILSALLGGVALTGIPEFIRGGSLTEGCTLVATSSQESQPLSPGATSAYRPFAATQNDAVAWEATSRDVITQWQWELSLMVGGVAVPWTNGTYANELEITEFAGEESVAERLDAVQDRTALRPTGLHHVTGTLSGQGGFCEVNLYVRVAPASAFDGLLLIALWLLLALTVATIVVLTVSVSRSFSRAVEEPATATAPRRSRRGDDARDSATGQSGRDAPASTGAQRSGRDTPSPSPQSPSRDGRDSSPTLAMPSLDHEGGTPATDGTGEPDAVTTEGPVDHEPTADADIAQGPVVDDPAPADEEAAVDGTEEDDGKPSPNP